MDSSHGMYSLTGFSVKQIIYRPSVKGATQLKPRKKKRNVKIDQTIELPMGTIVFKGEVSDDELDYIIKLGLVSLYLRGELETTIQTEDGTVVSDVPDMLQ